jgi:hypothetical protein
MCEEKIHMNYPPGEFSEAIKRFQKWDTYIEEYRTTTGVSPDEFIQMNKAIVLLTDVTQKELR